ncbi:hypothetical protein B7P43_G04122 [Cryptotermes secundus]|uniref:Uncharacterized protein n=1 Tax=Cryptotermes secundus TaxID=105785 RepID=A0A2J7R3S3_9NEOP|nr:hypothetical protein B7P43_G04122 [Cryptotermes secundus]
MRLHSGYTNVMWIIVLCFLVQCLIISENKVHGKDNSAEEKTDVKKHETAAQKKKQTEAAVPQNRPSNGIESTNQSAEQVDNSSSRAYQETVQPSRKIISTGAFVRAFYVFVGVGAIVVMYIVVRTVRLRRRKSAVRKYGILASREDVELTPLGAEEEEEDTTLFEMSSHRSRP